MSKAVGYLEVQNLIRRERDPHRRAEHYVIDHDVWFEAMLASARATAEVADAVRDGARTLGTATPAGARLADLSEFLGHVGRDLEDAARRWRRVVSPGPAPDPGDGPA